MAMASTFGPVELLEQALGRLGMAPNGIATSLVVAFVAVAIGLIAHHFVFAALVRLTAKTTTTTDDRLVAKMRPMSVVLVLLIGVHVYLGARGITSSVLRTGVVILESLVVVYLLVELLETLVVHYWLSERKGVRVPAVLRHVVLVILYLAVGLSIIGSVTGVNLVPILATSTVLTVVLGLALQDTLGNLLAGLALHFERPFNMGDWVLIDGVEGEIVHLGWRSTRLRTLGDDIVALPNAAIARGRIQNFYAPDPRTGRRIELLVSLDARASTVDEAVARAAQRVARILPEPKPAAWLVGMTPLALRYQVRFFVDDFRVHDQVESDFFVAVLEECRAAGVALSPPAHVTVGA